MIRTIPVASPHLDEDDITAAVRVLRSGALVQGREVAAFEHEFSGLVDGRQCIAVNSGLARDDLDRIVTAMHRHARREQLAA